MAELDTKSIVSYLDQYLRTREIRDASLNGLQVQGRQEVTKIAFAVDACQESFKQAAAQGAGMLIVHHGLFWGKVQAITGSHYARLKLLLESDLNLYCSHLPLDAHPEVGNNAQLANALGLEIEYFYGDYQGTPIAVYARSESKITAEELRKRLAEVVGGHVRMDAFGPDSFRDIGICSGAGASLIPESKSLGMQAFITGEPRQSFYHYGREEQMHLYYGRHYDTETIGLKALASHLQEVFQIETCFLDIPTEI